MKSVKPCLRKLSGSRTNCNSFVECTKKAFETMKLDIKIIPGAKKNFVKEEEGLTKIYITAPAVDGKANKALVAFLAEHFSIKKNQISIIKGLKSRNKTINIRDNNTELSAVSCQPSES